jgi:predicted TIM-barrel fold metal-dependent hydrolase
MDDFGELGQLGHPVFDADNHYYEALDAFTRHLDPALGTRCVQWCEIDGRKYQVLGGRVSRAVSNPTFNPIAQPGALYDYFRGNPDGKDPLAALADHEPIRAAYRDPAARLATLDEQGLAADWLFPTLGMIYEEPLKDDPFAVCATFRAFNRWLEDDWGLVYEDRIFSAPYLTLADPEWAVEELEWALDRGARMIVMRPAAPTTASGRCSPFDPRFDGFWSRLNEAGITLVLHASDGGVSFNGYAPEGFAATYSGGYKASIKMFAIEQAIKEWMASLVFENHLVRFPNLRIASVENGAQFLPDLFRKLTSTAARMPGYFPDAPTEIFKRHVWINPFWEDDVHEVVDFMGADRVLFGSDWPHIEALPEPLDYLRELKDFDAADRKKILFDNVTELTTLRPA